MSGNSAKDADRPSEDKLIEAGWRDAFGDEAGEETKLGNTGNRAATDASSVPHDAFPGYQIKRPLRRGGQAVVYEAIQNSTRRNVAIKVMKDGGPLADGVDRARFEREVQILGQLRHPNIVAIYDTGLTADSGFGRHFFFVMDYVMGVPLDWYVEELLDQPASGTTEAKQEVANFERKLPEILRVFINVCDAVNAAHLRGVMHRDLKPSNILVDSAGEPRVLDFGLAKIAARSDVPGTTAPGDSREQSGVNKNPVRGSAVFEFDSAEFTQTGQFVGSLPWASPEQAASRSDDLDLRTDVYSLGVCLFQVLTSRFPYDVQGPMPEVIDRICHAAPDRPGAVRRGINGEIDTIVLKCLSKDRERRYQSAGELARDLQRYLDGEPIEAKRDSGWYVLRKLMRRHRLQIGVVTAFFALVCGGGIASTLLWRRAARAEASIRGEREHVAAERDRAIDAENLAADEARRARQIVAVLQDILAFSAGGAAAASSGALAGMCEVLERSLTRVETELWDQPESYAQVLDTLGRAFTNLGLAERAEPLLRRGLDLRRELLGDDHADVAASLEHLATALREREQFADAEDLQRASLAIHKRLHAGDHPTVARNLKEIGDLIFLRNRYAEATPLYEEALAMRIRLFGEEHVDVAQSYKDWADLLFGQRRTEESVEFYERVLAMRRRLLPPEHLDLATSLKDMGDLLQRTGDLDTAESYYREALRIRRKLLAPYHPGMASILEQLGSVLMLKHDYAGAEPVLGEALTILHDRYGIEHRRSLNVQSMLGECVGRLERFEESERLLVGSFAAANRGSRTQRNLRDLRETASRLTSLYRTWNKEDRAGEWAATLQALGQENALSPP